MFYSLLKFNLGRFYFSCLSLLCFLILFQSCTEPNTSSSLSGAQLAQRYCATCHQYPSPEILDKNTWEKTVLPRMGYFMGVYDEVNPRQSLLEKGLGGEQVKAANIFPEQAILSSEEWHAIQAFYLDLAPEKLEVKQAEINTNLPGFQLKWPQYQLFPPSTTLVKLDEGNLLIGDAHTKSLMQFDGQLNLQKIAKVGEGGVWAEKRQGATLLTIMGSFSPTDAPRGKIIALSDADGSVVTLLDSLQRPVHTNYGDLNQDGRMDILVCEFGKWTGGLSWYEARPGQPPLKHVLRKAPGATKAYLQDMNGDQLTDIIALFGQGDEGIFIYYNEGQDRFKEERILQFPASYGSSYFALQDLDQDGDLDIIYTAGDNADYSPVLKPYHGIYYFTNDGRNNFNQSFFYHLNGAYAAHVHDYDGDGDLDIVAISFFPDFLSGAKEGFVFLMNEGNSKYDAFTFPEVADGRWIVMDSGDVDQDGDIDVLLGSLAFEVVEDSLGYVRRWQDKGLGFVLLENMLN